MADTPSIKLQYEYTNPNNIEAEVPGGHELRRAPLTTDEGQATASEDNTVEVTENFTLAPVITVTKKEATFTKGDLKLQKVTVTEDISEEDKQNGEKHVRQEIRRVITHNTISRSTDDDVEVRNGGSTDNKEDNAHGEKKAKTRIPKLKQTVERIKERRNSKDTEKKEMPSLIPTPRRSSIPKLSKESKLQLPAVKKEVIIVKKEVITKPDDEFDKIYDEIVENKQTDVFIDENILNTQIEDPEKLETKFEEIIHDYEDNKVQPIQVEKVRHSKIPFLKRKSEPEIEIPTTEKTTKISSSVDRVKVKNTISKLKEPSIKVNTESSVKKQLLTQKVIKTITTKTVLSNDGNEEVTTSEVQTTTPINVLSTLESVKVVDLNMENSEDVTEKVERSFKETVKKVRPDFRKHFSEIASIYKENNDSDNIENPVDVTDEIEHTVKETVKKVRPDIRRHVSETTGTYKENHDNKIENTVEVMDEAEYEIKETVKTVRPDFRSHFSKMANTYKQYNDNTNIESPIDVSDKVVYRVKETVKTRPDFRKHFSEMASNYKENPDNDAKVTITEIKDEVSGTNNVESLILIENQCNSPDYDIIEPPTPAIEDSKKTVDDIVNITEIKEIENEDFRVKSPVKERVSDTEEDMPILRGKVGRMINKITFIDTAKDEEPKNNFSDEIPKKRSVLSRIAMFERQEPEEPLPKTQFPRKETKITKVFKETYLESTNKANDKPVIVDEVLKPVVRKDDSTTYSNTDQIQTEETANLIKDVTTLEEILEPLDKELDSIEREQNTLDAPEELEKILDSTFNDNNDEIRTVNRNESLVMTTKPTVIKEVIIPRKSDPNDNQLKVDFVVNTHLVIEECKVIGDMLKQQEFEPVHNLPTELDLTDNKFNDNIPSKHTVEVNDVAKTIDDVVTLPQNSTDGDAVLYETIESFDAINNEPKRESNKDEKFILEKQNTISVNRNKLLYEKGMGKIDTELKGIAYKDRSSITDLVATITNQFSVDARDMRRGISTTDFESNSKRNKVQNDNAVRKLSRKENDDVFEANIWCTDEKLSKFKNRHENCDIKRAKSLAELDLGDAVKGQVNRMIVSMISVDKSLDIDKKEVINIKERPRKQSVLEKIALFERKLTPVKMNTAIQYERPKLWTQEKTIDNISEEVYIDKIAELNGAKLKYGKVTEMPTVQLRNGTEMPVLAVGTALLDRRLITQTVMAAIDLGYRSIDTAHVYGNEREVGAAIKAKIEDGTVKREDLFIINKLWSTFHRQDLVETACRASLNAMGLDYFDLYLIHNPMSFKEGPDPFPKIATVLQYSAYDFMDAWFGMELLVSKGLVRSIGLSNFNSTQVLKVVEKGRIKPVVNQVECHPYLSQQRLDNFCSQYGVKLSCYGVLGSKGTPLEYKSGLPAVIDDALVQVMASGLGVTPAQLLIRYQIQCGHHVVVKSSTGARLWDNLQALSFSLTQAEMDALNSLNRNKRIFTFKGMGDTHKNYPFSTAF